jgi:hypothetical protein
MEVLTAGEVFRATDGHLIVIVSVDDATVFVRHYRSGDAETETIERPHFDAKLNVDEWIREPSARSVGAL